MLLLSISLNHVEKSASICCAKNNIFSLLQTSFLNAPKHTHTKLHYILQSFHILFIFHLEALVSSIPDSDHGSVVCVGGFKRWQGTDSSPVFLWLPSILLCTHSCCHLSLNQFFCETTGAGSSPPLCLQNKK